MVYPADRGLLNVIINIPSYDMYTMEGKIEKVTKNELFYKIDTSSGQRGAGICTLSSDGMADCLGGHVKCWQLKR